MTAVFGNNRIEVQDKKGHKSIRRSSHDKYIEPNEKIVQQLPSEEVLNNYRRTSKLVLAAKDVPNLQFDVIESNEQSKPPEGAEVMEIMDMTRNECAIATQNSDFREHSKNLLGSEAGEALGQNIHQGIVKVTSNSELQNKTSKYREHSQKSWNSRETTAAEQSGEVVSRTLDRDMHLRYSKEREYSRNSWVRQTRRIQEKWT